MKTATEEKQLAECLSLIEEATAWASNAPNPGNSSYIKGSFRLLDVSEEALQYLGNYNGRSSYSARKGEPGQPAVLKATTSVEIPELGLLFQFVGV